MSDSSQECIPSLLPRYQQDLALGDRFDSIAAAERNGNELSEKEIRPDNDPNTCNAEHKQMINDKLTSIPPNPVTNSGQSELRQVGYRVLTGESVMKYRAVRFDFRGRLAWHNRTGLGKKVMLFF